MNFLQVKEYVLDHLPEPTHITLHNTGVTQHTFILNPHLFYSLEYRDSDEYIYLFIEDKNNTVMKYHNMHGIENLREVEEILIVTKRLKRKDKIDEFLSE